MALMIDIFIWSFVGLSPRLVLEYEIQELPHCSPSFTVVYPVLWTVPNTQQSLNKYLLNGCMNNQGDKTAHVLDAHMLSI